jgi:dynein heavy chain 2
MSIDLHRHQQKWKDILTEIRLVFKEAETYGFAEKNMRTWKAHWDRQLYKVLEHQYQLGLESLQQQIPEIKVELIFR